jgi:hypothetical protein
MLPALVCLVACQNRAYGPAPKRLMFGTQPTYACAFTHRRPDLGGSIENMPWSSAPWSDPFMHVSGDGRASDTRTWVKLMWDEGFLYVAALVETPDVRASHGTHDEALDQEDNFTLLLDPVGDGRELFVIITNARGAIRDVRLARPPSQGGVEELAWNCPGLDGGVRVQGTLNDASDKDRSWTFEMAIPWECLGTSMPAPGDVWRANFMRNDLPEAHGSGSERGTDARAWAPSWNTHFLEAQHWGRIEFTRTQ